MLYKKYIQDKEQRIIKNNVKIFSCAESKITFRTKTTIKRVISRLQSHPTA